MQDPNIVDIYTPFDGQKLISADRTLFEYDAELLCWVKIGPLDDLPTADDVTTGLLTASFKQMLDKIPEKGGAFNIVVKPFLSMKSPTNPDGLLRDVVNLTSDSLDIGCQDQKGNPITGKCVPCTNPSATYPAITMKLSEEFLKTLCIQTTTAKGPKGDTGDRGDPGKDGTGDGPQGDSGDPGKDAVGSVSFAGIEIVDMDDVYDSAVTAVEVDQNAGKLAVTKARVRAPDSNTPATQLITTQIDRSIAFTRGFEYSIQKPATDASETDVTMVAYPQGFKPDGTSATQINAVKLSSFLDLVISDYRARLTQIDSDYSQKVKDFILAKDAAARDALNELACKLSEAEWNLPVDTCCLPGTRITVAHGLAVPIESLNVGDSVLCGDGKLHKITKKMARQVDEEITEIHPSGCGTPLALTSEHPVKVAKLRDARRIDKFRHKNRISYRQDLTTSDFKWVSAKQIEPGDLLFKPQPGNGDDCSLSSEWCEFLGYYAAEGDARGSPRGPTPYCTRFSLGLHEGKLAQRIAQLGILFGASSVSIKDSHVKTVYVYSQKIAGTCIAHIGKGARSKKLSPQIVALRGLKFLTFIRALYAGDGCITTRSTAPSARLCLASLDMIDQLQWLMLSNGISASKRYCKEPGGPTYRERYRIRGRLNLSCEQSRKIWPDIRAANAKIPSKTFEIDGGLAHRVESVAQRYYKGPVYNLEVAKDNTYIANGVVVHNCIGWTPADCHETGDQQGNPMPLAGEIFGGDFCEDSVGFEIGRFTIPAGAGYSSPPIYVTDVITGSSTMAVGGYIISYISGSYYDPTGSTVITINKYDINGNIIGTFNVISGSGRFVGPSLEVVEAGITHRFPAASASCKSDPEVRAAYDRAPFTGRTVSFQLATPGQIILRANVPVRNNHPIDSVVVRVFRVAPCPTTPPPGST